MHTIIMCMIQTNKYLAPDEIFENILQLKRFVLYFERILTRE